MGILVCIIIYLETIPCFISQVIILVDMRPLSPVLPPDTGVNL